MTVDISANIHEKEWNEFHLQTKPEALFQSWLWGVVLVRQKTKIWRLAIRQNGTIIGIMLASLTVARRGTFLHVRHGPVLQVQSREIWDSLLETLKSIAKTEKAWFIRISPLLDNSIENKIFFSSYGFLPAPIHAMNAELCWVLDLEPKEDTLLSGMRKTTRYEIHKALKRIVEIKTSESISDLAHFHHLYSLTARRQGFVPHSGIDKEFEVFAKQHKALIFKGSLDGVIKACAIILFCGNQAIYHHSASIPTHEGVNYLLQWEAIKEAKKRGMNVYNFWGIAPENNPNHPWRGITMFKKGFGGRQIEYMHAQDLPVSSLYIIPRAIESVRKLLRHY